MSEEEDTEDGKILVKKLPWRSESKFETGDWEVKEEKKFLHFSIACFNTCLTRLMAYGN